MSNAKKHDSGASEGARRATEDAPESSATAGGFELDPTSTSSGYGQPNSTRALALHPILWPTSGSTIPTESLKLAKLAFGLNDLQ